jgi:hypothetical protein
MAIAENPALVKPDNAQYLPQELDDLYILARLSPEEIEDGIANGCINADLLFAEDGE